MQAAEAEGLVRNVLVLHRQGRAIETIACIVGYSAELMRNMIAAHS